MKDRLVSSSTDARQAELAPQSDTDTKGQPFPWSASRLKRLLQCPRQFRYVYIDKLPTVTTAPLAFGRTVHEILRVAQETWMVTGELPPVTELLDRFEMLWSDTLKEEAVSFRANHPEPRKYATSGREMLRLFHRQHHETAPPLAVEVPFEIELAGQRLRGIIDRIDEARLDDGQAALTVIDYKCGRRPGALEANQDLQLTVYAFAIEALLGLPLARVEFLLLRDGASLASERGSNHFYWLSETLRYGARTVSSGQYPACPGYWCAWCDFRRQCQQEGVVPGVLEKTQWSQEAEPAGGEEHGVSR